jgi:hypothetical protein
MRSNLVVLMAALAFAGPAGAIAATTAASASSGTSSPATSASSGGFASSSSSSSSSGSGRSSGGSGGGGSSFHSGGGTSGGARGFVSSGGFRGGTAGSSGARGFVSSGGFNRGEFAGASHTSVGGQQSPPMHSLTRGAMFAVHNPTDARQPHRPHRPRPDYNFDCGTRGASAVCYANYNNEYNTPDAQRWWYCSAATPAIERALYCDRIEKTKVGER